MPTADLATLRSLLSRVQEATEAFDAGTATEMACELARAVDARVDGWTYLALTEGLAAQGAALALADHMSPGSHWRIMSHGVDVEMGDTHPFSARLLPSTRYYGGATPALAILAALLSALIAIAEREAADAA